MSFRLWLLSLFTGSRFKAQLMEGNRMLEGGRHLEAINLFRKVSHNWPDHPEGYRGMAAGYQAMGLRPEAAREDTIAECLDLLQDDPKNAKARLELAQVLSEKDMHSRAAAQIDQVLKFVPHTVDLLQLAARLYTRNRNHTMAAQVLRELIQEQPLEAAPYELLAYNLRATHRTVEAQKASAMHEVLKAVKQEPGNPAVVGRAVRQFAASGTRRLAMALVERCIKDNPTSEGLFRIYGQLLLDERNPKDALLALRRAADLNPLEPSTHRLLVKVYEALGNPELAAHHQALLGAMEKSRNSQDPADTAVNMVQVLIQSGQMDRAEAQAQELREQYPESWQAPFAMALILLSQGKKKEALAALIEARRMGPKAAEPRMELARLLMDLGRGLEAVGEARHAVTLRPRDPEARMLMAEMLKKQGYMDQAIQEEELAESLANPDKEIKPA